MGKKNKQILGVGDSLNTSIINDYLMIRGGEFGCDDCVNDVSKAIEGIDSGKYWGVLLNSLVVKLGDNAEQHRVVAKQFEMWDHPPCLFRSGGLFVVQHAVEKGLATVVNPYSEGGGVLVEAEKLGAITFPRDADRSLELIFGAFRSCT